MCLGFVWLRIILTERVHSDLRRVRRYLAICVCGDEHGGKLSMALLSDESLLVKETVTTAVVACVVSEESPVRSSCVT